MSMTKDEIIASLKDQAKDKDILANGERDSIFTRDAQALREAAEMLKKSEVVKHGRWEKGGYAYGEAEWKCSVCGGTDWRILCNRMEFCMLCGAKMDGGKDDAQE